MDLGNVIYVIAVIAYFIYSATQSRKKKREQQEAAQRGQDQDADVETYEEEAPDRGVTFEDLLKEIREAQAPPQEKPKKIKPAKRKVEERNPYGDISPVDRQPTPTPTSKPVRTKRYVDDEIEIDYSADAFEKMKKEEERIAKVAASIPSQKDGAYEQQKRKSNRYAKLLKDPQSVRDAIVLNEILRRKHF